jgi:hypothetical protein
MLEGITRIVNSEAKTRTPLDLQVVAILALLVPLALAVLPIVWALVTVAILPQGRILTRAADLRAFQRPAIPHIFLHEALLGFVIALCLAGWYVLHSN